MSRDGASGGIPEDEGSPLEGCIQELCSAYTVGNPEHQCSTQSKGIFSPEPLCKRGSCSC